MKKLLIIFALSLYSMFAFAFQQFEDFYFFGDSLSDVGNEPGRSDRNNGAFWSELLSNRYGQTTIASKEGGHDWAHSGARTYDTKDTHGKTIDGLQKQVSSALSVSNINKRGLYSIWCGANDMNRIIEEPGDITKEFVDKIAWETQNNILSSVQHLHDAGARYIMVLNLPDISKTPLFKENPFLSEAAEKFSEIIRYYNSGLSNRLNQLAFSVIQIDAYSLLRAVIANPERYGFSNVTERYKKPSVMGLPNLAEIQDPDKYLFHDERHPTAAGNRLIFDLVNSVFQGAANAAVLQDAPLAFMSNSNLGLANELAAIRNKTVTLTNRYRTFVTGISSATTYSANGLNLDNYRQSDVGVTVGIDYRWSKNIVVGTALSHSFTDVILGNTGSHFKMAENLLSLFTGYQRKKLYMNGIANLGLIDYQMNRNIVLYKALDVATSRARATHWGGQLELGYNLFNAQIKSGPFGLVTYQHINVEPFAEQGASEGANLQYYRMVNDSLITGLGWQFAAPLQLNNRPFMPYAQLSYNKDWLRKKDVYNGVREVEVGPVSIPGSRGAIPVGELNNGGWMLVNMGVNTQLANNLSSNLSIQGSFFRKQYTSYAILASLRMLF